MSISAIVGRGYGSFGSVAQVPTRGYSSGEEETYPTKRRAGRKIKLPPLARPTPIQEVFRALGFEFTSLELALGLGSTALEITRIFAVEPAAAMLLQSSGITSQIRMNGSGHGVLFNEGYALEWEEEDWQLECEL